MTDEQKRLISSLKNDPAYLSLISHLEEEVGGMLSALADAETPQDILRLTRLWQVARKIIDKMRYLPEALTEVIREETERPAYENLLAEDEDPFTRPRRPIPPPYQENC